MTQQNKITKYQVEEDEIDLIALAKTLLKGRKTVIKTTFIFVFIGLFIAVFSKKEFTSSTKVLSQSSESQGLGGDLGGLAAMAGINLGNLTGTSAISPDLYPKIIESIPFQKELLKTKLTIEGQDNKISYSEYYLNIYNPGLLGYIKKYTIGLPGLLRSAIKDLFKEPKTGFLEEKFVRITDDEEELIERLLENVTVSFDKKDEYITVSAIMPEPLAAAEMAEKVKELLQNYIIDFKIKKSLEKLKFIKERHKEKEDEFRKAQTELARFRDSNVYVNTSSAKITTEILQSEYDLAFSVYSGLSKQLEAYQIEVKEDTPVFSTIDPVSIPFEKSAPKRTLILVFWTFLGVITGVGIVLGKEYLNKIIEKF